MAERFTKNIVGYANPLSVRPGDTLDVFVSCEQTGRFNASLVQLISGDARPHGTGFREIALDASFAGSYPAVHQALTPGSFAVLPSLPESEALTFACFFQPTLLEANEQTLVHGDDFEVRVASAGIAIVVAGNRFGTLPAPRRNRWHRLVVCVGAHVDALLQPLAGGPAESSPTFRVRQPIGPRRFRAGDWELARAAPGRGHFNGRIEAVRIYGRDVGADAACRDLELARPARPGLNGAWDFSLGIDTSTITDVSGHARHGTLHQLPTRAVRGAKWRGDVFDWRADPSQYAAIHFHDDDLADACWQPSFSWPIPDELPSGVYAVKLTLGDGEDYVPFFVRPGANRPRARVAYLASTATYLAYANQRMTFIDGVYVQRTKPLNANDAYLLAHPEVGPSLYDCHRDGSGVHYSSRLRPVLNLKPKGIAWAFTADTNLLAWLHHTGERYDVVTDEELHCEGAAALAGYRVVITGTHPEYYTTAMLDGVTAWLGTGGRLMYMGGNGFYWRIAYCPTNPAVIEVRRAEDGTRAWMAEPGEYHHAFTGEYGGLWRRNGRPPNQLVGIGFAAQGFDGGTYYRVAPQAADPRVAFAMAGLGGRTIIGAHGTQGGGAAGEEIDRYDPALGSPRHALVIATSENHRPGMLRVKEEFLMMHPLGDDPDVRADMTFFETPAGGAVFSTGSISYAGALSTNGYDNDIARLTGNVLRRFLDPAPFEHPEQPPSVEP